VRTAQRWEKAGLPVHRAYESQRCPVMASVPELDFWIRCKNPGAREQRSALRPLEATKLAEVGSEQRKIHRRTKRLLTKVTQLRAEHRRLIVLIKKNLTTTEIM
jgi:hypothetical protein